MSKLLINEPPLQVLPTLAAKIGLNEAIVLQQIHYWISNPKVGKTHDGRRWVYNSVREWQEENFPFWSERTIKRTLASLREQGVVLAENLNAKAYDRTLWYSIDYDALAKLEQSIVTDCHNGGGQGDTMDNAKMSQPIPETTTENTKENDDDPIFARVRQLFGGLNGMIANEVDDAIKEFGRDRVMTALDAVKVNQLYSWRYVDKILKQQGDNAGGQASDDKFAIIQRWARNSIGWRDIPTDVQHLIRAMTGKGGPEDLQRLRYSDTDLRVTYHQARKRMPA